MMQKIYIPEGCRFYPLIVDVRYKSDIDKDRDVYKEKSLSLLEELSFCEYIVFNKHEPYLSSGFNDSVPIQFLKEGVLSTFPKDEINPFKFFTQPTCKYVIIDRCSFSKQKKKFVKFIEEMFKVTSTDILKEIYNYCHNRFTNVTQDTDCVYINKTKITDSKIMYPDAEVFYSGFSDFVDKIAKADNLGNLVLPGDTVIIEGIEYFVEEECGYAGELDYWGNSPYIYEYCRGVKK